MDKNNRFSLNACNIRLKADKAIGLHNYYINRKKLTEQILQDKIADVFNSIKMVEKLDIHTTKLINKYKPTIDDFQEKANLSFSEWETLTNSLKPDIATQGQTD
tara:strand:+ start:45 stop:356 length:312 start_codon:yes stop_codon:yes gene_type:complete